MRRIAHQHQLPEDGLDFMLHTFEILQEARKYYFQPYSEEHIREIKHMVAAYNALYPTRYAVRMEFTPFSVKSSTLRGYMETLLREQRGYRLVDHLFTLRLLSMLFPLLRRAGNGVIPDFMHKQAMGLEAVFK
jgi:hypothetical protein